jgi:hypothetical protein
MRKHGFKANPLGFSIVPFDLTGYKTMAEEVAEALGIISLPGRMKLPTEAACLHFIWQQQNSASDHTVG